MRTNTACVAMLVMLAAAVASAQTPIVNPSLLEFDPSPDHSLTFIDANGVTVNVVTNYTWEVYNSSGLLVSSFNLQKPTPNAAGKIVIDIRPELGTLTGNLMYTSKVNVVGPGGTSTSGSSNPFVISGPAPVPRPPANVVLKKLT